jgi:hypothetical protein
MVINGTAGQPGQGGERGLDGRDGLPGLPVSSFHETNYSFPSGNI